MKMADTELADAAHKLFLGNLMMDVFGVCLSALIVAAKDMKMSKLEVQRIFVEMWDKKV